MAGMDSRKLSARAKQPGHDRTFTASEGNFIESARRSLDAKLYRVEAQPGLLSDLFGGVYGVKPEAVITNVQTKRMLFVEVKKQGDAGNAEERAYEHHTVQFYRTLHERFGYDYHPFVTVMCESLATNPRYTTKFPFLLEPDQYFCWVDYDERALGEWLRGRCRAWLDKRP